MTPRRAETSHPGSRLRRATRGLLLGATGFALAASLVAGPGASRADADPPLTIAEAKAQVEQLEVDAEALDQKYVGVREELRDGSKKLTVKQADMKAQTAKVAEMRLQVGQVALAKFQNRNLDTAAQLFFTKDTEDFLSQISTVEKVSENQNTTLQDFQSEQAKLAELQRSSETDVADLKAKQLQLEKLRAASKQKIVDSKAILARLTKEERERIAEEERKARAAALAAAKAAGAPGTSDMKSSGPSSKKSADKSSSSSGANKSSSNRGERVMAFAKRQLGKPYVFAAEGPEAYDCSGLVLAAWKSVGVSLPRLADDQLTAGRRVSRSELRPGDVIGYYSPVHHVGLYLGNGKIIDAPRPGKSVRIVSIDYMPYNWASRPAG